MYIFILLYLFMYLNPSVYASNSSSNLTPQGLLGPPCSHVCNCSLQPWETCSQYPPCSYLSALLGYLGLGLSNPTDHTRANPPAPVKRKGYMCAKSLQSFLTLSDPVDCSSPCSSVHRFLQARILEWVAVPSSRGSSRPKDGTHVSWCVLHWHADSLPLAPPGKLACTLGWTSSLPSWGLKLLRPHSSSCPLFLTTIFLFWSHLSCTFQLKYYFCECCLQIHQEKQPWLSIPKLGLLCGFPLCVLIFPSIAIALK